ncbi:hypothetical protein GYMLUDRAFT_785612 [Collybiopsis luxurians FD-317 M1]|nr:hypothetical protein GYMLUDRAFT_785612 [Collybiopsis luxurians FD-317 M1]
MKKSITRLQDVSCKWGGCEIILNSVQKLARHMRLHVIDLQQVMGKHAEIERTPYSVRFAVDIRLTFLSMLKTTHIMNCAVPMKAVKRVFALPENSYSIESQAIKRMIS